MLKELWQLMFQQQKELMKDSNDSFKETMTQITASFLQRTQSMLSQLITPLPQAFVQPSSPFRSPQMYEAPTWSFGQTAQPYNQYVQRSNATASPLHRATRQADVHRDAMQLDAQLDCPLRQQDTVHMFSPLGYPGVDTDVQGTSDTNTGQD